MKVKLTFAKFIFRLFLQTCSLPFYLFVPIRHMAKICTVKPVYNDHPHLGTQNLWPLLTGGHCSEAALYYEN